MMEPTSNAVRTDIGRLIRDLRHRKRKKDAERALCHIGKPADELGEVSPFLPMSVSDGSPRSDDLPRRAEESA